MVLYMIIFLEMYVWIEANWYLQFFREQDWVRETEYSKWIESGLCDVFHYLSIKIWSLIYLSNVFDSLDK